MTEIDRKKRISFVLENLSSKEKEEFLFEMLGYVLLRDRGGAMGCFYGWEASAEINSDPKLKAEIISRSKSLKEKLELKC